MKKALLPLVLVIALISCKDENKEIGNTNPETEVETPNVEEPTKPKLPSNIVQLNEEIYDADSIILTKVQVENIEGNKFILKVFLDSKNMDLYKNGDYSLFIQNFAYEGNIEKLEEKFQKAGAASYWVNLKSLRDYRDEFVLFKSFESELINFEKTVVGVMNLKTKTDVFRVQYDDTIIMN